MHTHVIEVLAKVEGIQYITVQIISTLIIEYQAQYSLSSGSILRKTS